MRLALSAAILVLSCAIGPSALASPSAGSRAPAPSPSTSFPASSADLVARLFAEHAGDAARLADDAPTDAGLLARVRGGAQSMVETAMAFIGVPYRRGGADAEAGFDCSGFTRRVFESSVGLLLPRRASEQARAAGLSAVDREALQPGDLVFFNTLRRSFSHVGIYLGDHKFIHSPSAGGEVRIDDMRFAYWAHRFTGARRAELPAPPAAADTTPTTAPPAEPR